MPPSRHEHYVLRGEVCVPTDLMTWAKEFEDIEKRIIARTKVAEGIEVSTVFLGLDHGMGDEPPQLFESLVFGGTLDQTMVRYARRHEAVLGHRSLVKRAHNAAYYRANKEKIKAKWTRWAMKNPERLREYRRRYRLKNIEKDRARNRRWYLANKEKKLAATRAWMEANKERYTAQKKAYYLANRAKILLANKISRVKKENERDRVAIDNHGALGRRYPRG